MRNDDRHAVVFGGRVIPAEEVERMEEKPADPDEGAFWDSPEFECRWDDATNKTLAAALAGRLPPLVPEDPNSRAVLDAVKPNIAKEIG